MGQFVGLIVCLLVWAKFERISDCGQFAISLEAGLMQSGREGWCVVAKRASRTLLFCADLSARSCVCRSELPSWLYESTRSAALWWTHKLMRFLTVKEDQLDMAGASIV